MAKFTDLLLLDDEELKLAKLKREDKNKLIFAIMLKFFQTKGRYPDRTDTISERLITVLSGQLGILSDQQEDIFIKINWESRSIERFRQEIRELLGFKIATVADSEQFILWLTKNILPEACTLAQCVEKSYQFFNEFKLEPFAKKELDRYIRSAQNAFEKRFFLSITEQLSTETKRAIDTLIHDDEICSEDSDLLTETTTIKLRLLKKDLAGVKLKHVQFEIKKLQHVCNIPVPSVFLNTQSRKLLQKYYMRILASSPSNIEEYIAENRYAMMAIFCYVRSQLLTDNLADLFLQLIHKVKTSASKYIDKTILSDVKKVNGKFDILHKLADTSAKYPSGVIKEQIYPKVSQDKLQDLAKELSCNDKWYQTQVHVKMRSLYSHAHRKELLMLLEAFDFRSNHPEGKTLLKAMEFIKQHQDSDDKYYSDTRLVPIDGIIYGDWRPLVLEQLPSKGSQKNQQKVERMHYEMAVLELLHQKLTCKTIWIAGSYRYRNPDEDLPQDWHIQERREYYYKTIEAKSSGKEFTQSLNDILEQNLQQLNDTILSNEKVKILDKKGGRIKLTPYEPQPEPANII
ncbi:MAG: hypothetical protein ACD_69C00237G0002, partial [uncultured bacterium]